MSIEADETFIGDAVYASFDGYLIWLRTGDGNNQRIALDPDVFVGPAQDRAFNANRTAR